MTDYRSHLRDKYLDYSPDTREWEDPEGDYVVLVSPPESFLEKAGEWEAGDEKTQTEVNARLTVKIAHSPKTDADGELIRREGDLVPGDRVFEESDVKMLQKIPLGHPLGQLRQTVVEWFQELRDGGVADYVAFAERAAGARELLDDADPEDYEKALVDLIESAEKLVDEEPEGNS